MIIAAVSFGQKKPVKPVNQVKFVPPVIVRDTVINNVQEVTPPPPPPPPKKIHVKHHTKPATIAVPPKPPTPPAKPKKEMKEEI